MNRELLLSDADHFRVDYEINPHMHTGVQPDRIAAVAEHRAIVAAHLAAGRQIEYLPSAPECPDMLFTANAAVVRGNPRAGKAVMTRSGDSPSGDQDLGEPVVRRASRSNSEVGM